MTDDDTNITKIRMEAEAAANLSIGGRDAEHTIGTTSDARQKSAESLVDRGVRGEIPTGDEIRADLLRRAEEKRALAANLGDGLGFLDYKRSEVGGIGGNKEIRRELTLTSRKERAKREQRFGRAHKEREAGSRRRKPSANDKRQAFNANSDKVSEGIIGANRQEFNVDNGDSVTSFGGHTIGYREPTSRGYDPYS